MLATHDSFHAGMPHLDIFGLSEHFCLTHAGNLHWKWIATLTAKRPSEWVSADGHRIYASFIYTSLKYNREVEVSEDDEISVVCHPCALKPPFFVTETTYSMAGSGLVATARMMSTLSTSHTRSNTRFGKTSMTFQSKPFGEAELEETRQRFRQLRAHDDRELVQSSQHLVNPAVDFNAAKFMYFANFSQLFKRYEYPELGARMPLASREIAYFGNVDPFELTCISSRRTAGDVISAMTRSSDQKCIARSFSQMVDADQARPASSQFGAVAETPAEPISASA
ncbi:hypothetical protein RUESEDTHA_03726 [Ruegeria sp. THAF57]|uniref:LnmK family bifunctional acyltransferase/decarboxylase n=1 Tax=Ruegeria sp. THAF57 TaxID=2744555 RepID=UPI0015DF756D|nr:LnmK family bifunctional acyltransferase/decarboxylase [Ruegeria sp. THAF57]CAD0186815.1 hypothetical protein RUESEDTHA_03726 [Ruegeria sp. THAF57]